MKTAVVNRIINEKGECLFLLRKNKPFGWDLVGGKVEGDEAKTIAALRETREESQINPATEDLKHIGSAVSVNGTPVEIFETVLSFTPKVIINKAEHLSYRWIKTHRTEYAGDYTDEVHSLQFAGNTLEFLDLDRPMFFPDYSSRTLYK